VIHSASGMSHDNRSSPYHLETSIAVSIDASFEDHQRFLNIEYNTSLMKRSVSSELFSEGAWTCSRIWWSEEAYAHGIPSFNKEEDTGWRRRFSLQLVVELRIPTIPFLTSSVGLVVSVPNYIPPLKPQALEIGVLEMADWRSNMSRLSLVLIATLNTNRWEIYHKTQNFQHSNRKMSPRLLIQVWARRCCWRDKSPSMLMTDGRTVCRLSLVLENLNATMWDSMYRGKTQNFQHPMNRNQSPRFHV